MPITSVVFRESIKMVNLNSMNKKTRSLIGQVISSILLVASGVSVVVFFFPLINPGQYRINPSAYNTSFEWYITGFFLSVALAGLALWLNSKSHGK